MNFYLLEPVRGLARWYRETGDDRFIALSKQLMNFCLRPKFWGGLADVEPLAGAKRGHFWGHCYGRVAALLDLLECAIVAGDYRAKEFVRDGYKWARHHGIHGLGVFPGSRGDTEGCTVVDMVGLAVKLTEAGMEEYWEDVDHYSRNGLLAIQATNLDEPRRVSNCGIERPAKASWGGDDDMRFVGYGGVLPAQETTDQVLERSVGAIGHLAGARSLKPRLMHCFPRPVQGSAAGSRAAITRYSGTTAEVNLWLNRRSPGLDVSSWLPYSGSLVAENKGMERVAMRIPAWARRSEVRCSIDGAEARPDWVGDRILFTALKGGESLTIEAPVQTERAHSRLANLNARAFGFGQQGADDYDCEFKGNAVLSVGAPRTAPAARPELGTEYSSGSRCAQGRSL